MKVYVLLVDACNDYEQETNVFVYQTLGAAQEAMFGCEQSFLHENAADSSGWVAVSHSSKNICYQEAGDYTRNHIEWTIYERDVELDKELQNADEKGSGGLWDKAAEITMTVALEMQANDLTNPNVPALYAEDCGQERVYELLKELQQ